MAYASGVLANFDDFLDQVKAFLCGAVSINSYTGTGNGTLTRLDPMPEILTETWTITATSDTNFTVTGSVSGAQAAATVGTEYDNGFVRFLISAGGTPFVATDEFVLDATGSPLAGTLGFTSYTGTGDGTITRLSADTDCITETWTLTAINATTFSVTGSVSGAQANATVGTEYNNGFIRFMIRDLPSGGTPFVASDEFVLAATRLSSGGKTWECLKDSDVRSDFQDVTNGYITGGDHTDENTGPFDRRMYLKSTGTGGTDEIFYCISSFHNSTTYFNVEFRNMTSYNSLEPLNNQTGISPKYYMVLNDSAASNPYYFVGSGRRFIPMVRCTTVYESAYTGWAYPNGAPSEFPDPYVCGACSHNDDTIVSSQGAEHRAWFAPVGPAASGINVQTATLGALARDGVSWVAFGNYVSASSKQTTSPKSIVVPLFNLGGIGAIANSGAVRKIGTCYGNTDRIRRPVSLFSSYVGFKGCYGDLEGVFHCSGEGLAPEDVLVDVDNHEDYLAWSSTFYTHREAFAAIRLA